MSASTAETRQPLLMIDETAGGTSHSGPPDGPPCPDQRHIRPGRTGTDPLPQEGRAIRKWSAAEATWPWQHLWPFGAEVRPRVIEEPDGHWYISVPAAGPGALIAPTPKGGISIRGLAGDYSAGEASGMIEQFRDGMVEALHRTQFDGDDRECYLEAWRRMYLADTQFSAGKAALNLSRDVAGWPLDALRRNSQHIGLRPIASTASANPVSGPFIVKNAAELRTAEYFRQSSTGRLIHVTRIYADGHDGHVEVAGFCGTERVRFIARADSKVEVLAQ